MYHKMMVLMVSSTVGMALTAGCMAPEAGSQPDPTTPADPAPATAGGDAGLILRIAVEEGHAVSFYEPSLGGLFLAENIAEGQKFTLHDHDAVDALAAFARLRPGVDVPAALQGAYDRARNTASEPADLGVSEIGGGQPAAAEARAAVAGGAQPAFTSSSSAANFVNEVGGCNWGPTGSACRVNWSGNFFASLNPRTSGLCLVDVYAGNGVQIQITAGATITSMPGHARRVGAPPDRYHRHGERRLPRGLPLGRVTARRSGPGAPIARS
jgi:hypothetical protein